MKNYYQILTLEKFTSITEVKRAYRKLAFQYHPDHNPNNKGAEERFKEINEAYMVLSNIDAKRYYDMMLQQYTMLSAQQMATQAMQHRSSAARRPAAYNRTYSPRAASYTDPDDERLEKWLPVHIRIFGGFSLIYLFFFSLAIFKDLHSPIGITWMGIQYALTYALLLSVISFMIVTPIMILLYQSYKMLKPSLKNGRRMFKALFSDRDKKG